MTTKTTALAVGFCLDETGSMQPILGKTIDGFNEYLAGLDKKTVLSLTMFSDVSQNEPTFRPYCEATPVSAVEKLTTESYRPRGNTPLYDAIGHTVRGLEAWLTGQKKKPTILFVIQTDGQENASREYTRQAIFDLIRAKEADGWKFIYLGADQDAYGAERAAAAMGMAANSSVAYAGATTDSAFASLSSSTSRLAANPTMTSAQVAASVKSGYDLLLETNKKP